MTTFRAETTSFKNYTYRTPIVVADEFGELTVKHSQYDRGVLIKKLVLLNEVGYDKNNKLVSFKPIDIVNEFILSHHLDDGKLESSQLAQGMAHYFQFIIEHQKKWDDDYDADVYDPIYDEPRPSWDYFPKRKVERLTYKYRDALKKLVIDPTNKENSLASTTAKAYISSVVRFYKYYLRKGLKFNNPPFSHEIITLNLQSSSTSMNSFHQKVIHTTDLRLSFSKPQVSSGMALENCRRDLRPMSDKQWMVAQNILTKSKRVIRFGQDENKTASLPIEFSLGFMICRYTGLRREEMASLHLGQIIKPKKVIKEGEEVYENDILRLSVGDGYGSLTKTKGKGNKPRKTIIPARLMEEIYNYTQSERYFKRLNKFNDFCRVQVEKGNTSIFEGDDAIDKTKEYLFITQTGVPLFTRPSDFTGRWIEVRNTINNMLDLEHKTLASIHNLRSTFAVDIFRRLLRNHVKPDISLDYVASLLGHEDRQTTMEYLKIAQNAPTGDEIYEDVLTYLGVLNGFTEQINIKLDGNINGA
ncbi:site-specific integrase [Pseudoalteromonas sp. TAE56]|uniref:site-specific integrase n=1 Tax=Pseudoalteromonas sp. TAE56 TaxID=1938596 RepID=UPI000407C454|nr:site-specific integrase [Pseudoalteromonas sp. TAE56]